MAIGCGYRESCAMSVLPQEIVLYILNFCDWDHFSESKANKYQIESGILTSTKRKTSLRGFCSRVVGGLKRTLFRQSSSMACTKLQARAKAE
jgi:hypothetical protein